MKRWVLLAGAVVSHAAFATEVLAGADPVAVLEPVTYGAGATVPVDVKADCHVEDKVASDLGAALASQGLGGAATPSTSGLVLRATIERVIAQPGGGWSGPKTVSLSVELLKDGQVLRTTRQSFATKALNPFSKTCASIDRASEKLSVLIARWIVAPPVRAKAVASAASGASAAAD